MQEMYKESLKMFSDNVKGKENGRTRKIVKPTKVPKWSKEMMLETYL